MGSIDGGLVFCCIVFFLVSFWREDESSLRSAGQEHVSEHLVQVLALYAIATLVLGIQDDVAPRCIAIYRTPKIRI